MRGLFVCARRCLEGATGGVQLCTREYIEVIQDAGIELSTLVYDEDRRPLSRLKRLVNSLGQKGFHLAEIADRIVEAAAETKPSYIFLDHTLLAPIAAKIRERLVIPVKIVILSHGLESTDLLHFLRLRNTLPLSGRVRPTPALVLGRALLSEMQSRPSIDLVCVLSPFDAELENWLGSAKVCWLPRRVLSSPLQWQPQKGRFGWVGTLDHSPNLDGLVKFLDALTSMHAPNVRVRIVGAPERNGDWVAERYPFVDYLGALSEQALAAEASTWTAFLNPIFCQARGCSTKLATALGWQIPIVTTSIGRRGYVWSEGGVMEAATPEEFAEFCLKLLDSHTAHEARENIIKAAKTAPRTRDISQMLLAALADGGYPRDRATLPSAVARQVVGGHG